MKLQLDTEEKLITIEDAVVIDELLKVLKKILPDGLWKTYSIKSAVIRDWCNPVYIRDYTPPYYPWWGTYVTSSDKNPYEVTCGTYNIDTGSTITTAINSLNGNNLAMS